MGIVRDKDFRLHIFNGETILPELVPVSSETLQIINGTLPNSPIPKECFHLELKYLISRGFKNSLFQDWDCPVSVNNEKEIRNLVGTYFILYGIADYDLFSTMAIGVEKEEFYFLMRCFEDKLEDLEAYEERKMREEIENITLGMKNIGKPSRYDRSEITISDLNNHYHSFSTIFLSIPNIHGPIKLYYETIPVIIFIHLIKGVYRGMNYYLTKYGIKEPQAMELIGEIISIVKELKVFNLYQVQQFLTKWLF